MTSVSRVTRVTIVIPAFNAADYIGEAIESVLKQDYADFELIVIDDGSSDRTADIAAAFSDKLKLVRQANAGQSAALSRGWSLGTGELLGYLSADDRLRATAVRKCVARLLDLPDVVLVYPDFDVIDAQSHYLRTVHVPEYSQRRLYGQLHTLPGPGIIFRRSAYDRAGPWNPAYQKTPDMEFFMRMAMIGDFCHVPQVLADYRMHAKATTYRPMQAQRADEPLRMVEEFFGRAQLPASIRGWEAQSKAAANLLAGIMHVRSRRVGIAFKRLRAAIAAYPLVLLSPRGFRSTAHIVRGAVVGGRLSSMRWRRALH